MCSTIDTEGEEVLRKGRASFQGSVFSHGVKIAKESQGRGRSPRCPKIPARLREDGGGFAAQVSRFGETTLPVFIPEQIVPYK